MLLFMKRAQSSYGAYVPDLPGCAVVGETMAEVQKLITEAINFHIEGLQEAGYAVPPPSNSLVPMDPDTLSTLITVPV